MAPAVDVLHIVSPAVANLLVASIWQSLLLTGTVALCLRLVPEVPAGTKSGIWTAVLVLIVLLPAISMAAPRAGGQAGRAVHLANDWSLGLVCFWAAMSLFRAVQLLLSAARLRMLARSAEPIEVDATIAPLLQIGSRKAMLCTSEQVDQPSVIGFFRPRIILPTNLLENLSQPELEQIVLHEMEHLRRHDHWTNLLQQVSLVLLPWNPAVLWLNRRLCFERELACDDGVMRATKARKAYAACLVRLAEDSMVRRGVSLALGALGTFGSRARESDLVKRVQRILAPVEPGRGRKFLQAATASVLTGALCLSIVLARSPRLVDFSTAHVDVAAAGLPDAHAFAPVLAANRTGGAGPTLVNAVVSDPSIGRAVMKPAVLHKHGVAKHGRLNAASAMGVPAARPRLALASAEGSQTIYAAVPWRDGWLLIQL